MSPKTISCHSGTHISCQGPSASNIHMLIVPSYCRTFTSADCTLTRPIKHLKRSTYNSKGQHPSQWHKHPLRPPLALKKKKKNAFCFQGPHLADHEWGAVEERGSETDIHICNNNRSGHSSVYPTAASPCSTTALYRNTTILHIILRFHLSKC